MSCLSLELGESFSKEHTMKLIALGGFPEPYLSGSIEESRRWSRQYRDRLIAGDIRDLENIQDLGKLEHLMLRMPELVGSPLSINALHEDLQVASPSYTVPIRRINFIVVHNHDSPCNSGS
jgi:predicted AAA+ superfamily ATPase